MFFVNCEVKFSVEIPGLSTATNREIENSRVPHQVLTAQSVLRFRELQTSSIREIIPHDQQ